MHNTEATIATLKSLKLYGMANTIADLAEQSSPLFKQAEPILDSLLRAPLKIPLNFPDFIFGQIFSHPYHFLAVLA